MKFKKLLVILIVICYLTGCTKATNILQDDTIFHKLTSDDCEGRLAGTDGNRLAEESLVEVYESIDLEPYDGKGYLHNYEQIYYPLDKQSFSFEISNDNGRSYSLTYGSDYIERLLMPKLDFKYTVTNDISEAETKEIFLLVDKEQSQNFDMKKAMNMDNVKGLFFETPLFKKYLTVWKGKKPILQLSPTAFARLMKESNSVAHLEIKATEEIVQANNVIGKLSGKSDKEVLIISAHFDHVGKVGDTIYYGALDNASGVYGIAELAKRLKIYNDKEPLEMDVFFCAFNGEESGINGSTKFVEFISEQYEKIVCINLDSIGLNSRDSYDIVGDEHVSGSLMNSLGLFLDNKGIHNSLVFSTGLISDHKSFSNKHIPSLTIAEKDISLIHTSEDTGEVINLERIDQLVDSLYDYVISKQNELFLETDVVCDHEGGQMSSDDKETMNFLEKQLKEVPFNKYKITKYKDSLLTIRHSSIMFTSPDEISKIYDGLAIKKNFGDYLFHSVHLIDNSLPNIDYSTVELDKLYDREISIENVHLISIIYENLYDSTERIHIKVLRHSDDLQEINNDLGIKQITVDNHEYNITYEKKTNVVWDIQTFINEKYDIYFIRKSPDNEGKMRTGLVVNKLEDIEEFIRSITIEDIIDLMDRNL